MRTSRESRPPGRGWAGTLRIAALCSSLFALCAADAATPEPRPMHERISVGADGSQERQLVVPLDEATSERWSALLLARFDGNGNGRLDQRDWLRARTALQALDKGLASPLIDDGLRTAWNAENQPAGRAAGTTGQVIGRLQQQAREAVQQILASSANAADGPPTPEVREAQLLARLAVQLECTPAELLARHDSDGDGRLQAPAEQEALRATLQAWQEEMEVLRRFDADRDGIASAEEREQAAQERAEQQARLEQVRTARSSELFTRLDGDGDGQLSAAEFAAGLPLLQMELQRQGRPTPDRPERRGPGAPHAEGAAQPPQDQETDR